MVPQREFEIIAAPRRLVTAGDVAASDLLALYNASPELTGYITITDFLDGINVITSIGSSTDNAIVRWDGTDGSKIQNSSLTIDDLGNATFTGGSVIFTDSGGTDSVTFQHDGTDFNTTFVNTNDWVLAGFTGDIIFPNGTGLSSTAGAKLATGTGGNTYQSFPTADTQVSFVANGFSATHSTSVLVVRTHEANTEFIFGVHPTDGVVVRDGSNFTIYDSTETDKVVFSHDGTDVNSIFTNTTDWNISALAGAMWLQDGATLKISDSTDTDDVSFSHDGTDFNIAGTNTTDINVTGITAFNINGSAALVSGGALGTPASGDATNLTNKAVSSATVDATNGGSNDLTAVDITSIPTTVKLIVLSLRAISTNGTASILLQLGTSGTPETSSYIGTAGFLSASPALANLTSGFNISTGSPAASAVFSGSIVLSLEDSSSNVWSANGTTGRSDVAVLHFVAGSKSLAGAIDMIRLTTAGGTNTFDAGDIKIDYFS